MQASIGRWPTPLSQPLSTHLVVDMPLSDVGSIVLHHIVFLTHLVYITLAFSHAEPSLVVVLYFISKLVARRPEDIDPASWHPNAAKW